MFFSLPFQSRIIFVELKNTHFLSIHENWTNNSLYRYLYTTSDAIIFPNRTQILLQWNVWTVDKGEEIFALKENLGQSYT